MGWYGDREPFSKRTTPDILSVNSPFKKGLEKGEKNDLGLYYSGDVAARYSGVYAITIDTDSGTEFGCAAVSRYVKYHKSNQKKQGMCIMLIRLNVIPPAFVNHAILNDTGFMKNLQAGGFTEGAYYCPFFLFDRRTGTSINTNKLVEKNGEQYILRAESLNPDPRNRGGNKPYTNKIITQKSDTLKNDSTFGTLQRLYYENIDWIDTPLKKSPFPDDVKSAFKESYKSCIDKYNDADAMFNLISVAPPPSNAIPPDEYIMQGCQISASIPIFMFDDIESIYKYFKNGEVNSINKDDLVLSEIDLATNWKIYVNGERNPSIYITMNSPGVDAFLNDPEKNTGGYRKSDFKVEYLTPSFRLKVNSPAEHLEDIKEPSQKYDDMREMSWSSATDENYINKKQFVTDFWTGSLENAYLLYAQKKFRLFLKDDIFSTWCEMGIGFIGSPDLEDFKRIENWGSISEGEITDGSTVEIIYNQLPPGIDDYDDPDDEIPSPDETAPGGYDLESVLTKTYKTDTIQMQELGKYLWGTSFIEDIKLVNNNPIENLVGCKRIPVNIPAGDFENIVMGNVTTTASGQIVNNIPIIDVGSVKYEGYYKNFLDYSPYTRLILFLPFCGFTELDPSVVTGKTLSIKYAIDVVLGKCRAMLFVDDTYYASFDGNFGVDIPITSSNRAQVDAGLVASGVSALASAAMAPAQSVAKTVVSATMGGIESAVAAQYHSVRAGSYSSTCAWQETRTCFMIADIPTCQYPSSYAHDKGYPCQLTRSLSTMKGFTICNSDIDMRGFRCTEEEINMIREILTTGIYL